MMKISNYSKKIFKSSSIVYYYSSLFFPKEVKPDVYKLYSFVRTADNLVDSLPQRKDEFYHLFEETKRGLTGKKVNNSLINSYLELHRGRQLKDDWIISFLKSMEMDLKIRYYSTYAELEKYIYGSAEVVGLIMAKILKLPEKSYPTARLQGKAMQFLNFIRDIKEDLSLGRIYLPGEDLAKFNVLTLDREGSSASDLIKYELARYYQMQKEAAVGYKYIPKLYLWPIKTAADMYLWTAKQIEREPLIVFRKKVKPNKPRVIGQYFINRFALGR